MSDGNEKNSFSLQLIKKWLDALVTDLIVAGSAKGLTMLVIGILAAAGVGVGGVIFSNSTPSEPAETIEPIEPRQLLVKAVALKVIRDGNVFSRGDFTWDIKINDEQFDRRDQPIRPEGGCYPLMASIEIPLPDDGTIEISGTVGERGRSVIGGGDSSDPINETIRVDQEKVDSNEGFPFSFRSTVNRSSTDFEVEFSFVVVDASVDADTEENQACA